MSHFAPLIYFFTTEVTKTEFIAANHEPHWQSVMVIGEARRITEPYEVEHAMQVINGSNPTLTPAFRLSKAIRENRLHNERKVTALKRTPGESCSYL